MEWKWFFLILLSILLIGVLIFLAVWGGYSQNQVNSSVNITPLTTPVGFLYRCQDITCNSGFGCDPTWGTCKLILGSNCTKASQCVGDNFCSGVCVAGPAALTSLAADDPCPCPLDGTMTCSNKSPGSSELSCKLTAGQNCTQNSQCYSSSCINSTCTAGAANGLACQANAQCSSGNCSQGWCQPSGINTGDLDAVCVIPPSSGSATGPICASGTTCVNGTCSLPQAGLAAFCQANADCSLPLSCDNIDTGAPCPADGSASCICQYNFSQSGSLWRPDPNDCNEVGVCTTGYACTAGACQGTTNQPCTTNPSCISGVCLSQGSVFQLLFTFLDPVSQTQTTSATPSNAFGSFTVSWVRVSTNPAPGGGPVSRITSNIALSTGADQIYYVIPGIGVFDLDSNSLVPSSIPAGYVLIDAVAFGTGLLLFAFTDGAGGYYIYQQDGTPFNTPDGSQTSGGTLLTIAGIDANTNGDTLLLDTTGSVYVLPHTQTDWLLAKDNTGASLLGVALPRFYFDVSTQVDAPNCSLDNCPTNNCVGGSVCVLDSLSYQNLGYVGADPTYGNILQFTGNLQGAQYPVFDPTRSGGSGTPDKYSVLDQGSWSDLSSGISAGSFIMVATNQSNSQTNLFVTPGGSGQAVTAYVNVNSKVCGGSQGLYLYTTSLCS